MATTYYTTPTLVRDRFKFISSKLTDAKIEDQIEAAECLIDVLLQKSYKNIFDSTKHGILREVATLWVAIQAIDYDRSEGYDQGVDVPNVIEGLREKLDFLLKQLPLDKTRNMLGDL